MNAAGSSGTERSGPESTVTPEEHLRVAFQELRNAREAFQQRYAPAALAQRHPAATAIAAVLGGSMFLRLLRRKRRRGVSDDQEPARGSVVKTFSRSFLVGLARSAGRALPGVALYWVARRSRFGPFGFGRKMRGFDDARERR